MKYVIAIILPPLGMILVGRWLMALLCLLLMMTVLGWPLAAIWAVLVVNNAENEQRLRRALDEQARQFRR